MLEHRDIFGHVVRTGRAQNPDPPRSETAVISSPAFSPASISGLLQWVRADLGLSLNDNDLVTTWVDQSGQSNHLTQSTAANKPIFRRSPFSRGPAVLFDGTNDFLTSSLGVSQPYTRFVAFRYHKTHSGNVNEIICGGDSATAFGVVLTATVGGVPTFGLQMYAGTTLKRTSPALVPDDSLHIGIAVFNDTSSQIMQDGNDSTGAAGNGALAAAGLGALSNAGSPAAVYIHEAGIYNSALSQSNIAALNSYLQGWQ